ncbi:60S ribosomal protein l2 mitochondrial [Phtheirospermum japonicum]|uniref:60S ribosomal protein L2, mitochondrial n=1 Tax=Phtheirospermum japonicum TaxID=374723 RepID=A0A830B3E3_9LAMI|nr:60S ribosomal protein l2 mitochondrial [Phtheirospermum japonicum]
MAAIRKLSKSILFSSHLSKPNSAIPTSSSLDPAHFISCRGIASNLFVGGSTDRSKGHGYATIASETRPLKKLTLSNGGKSAGRNSSGRITIFHRGGGAKRLHRKIDLKRSTSSMGVVERIEYDPNRSTRIALVRWKGGAHQRKCDTAQDLAPPPKRTLESTTIHGPFAFSSLPTAGKVAPDQAKVACFSPGQVATYVTVGPVPKTPSCSKSSKQKTCTKDVLSSAFSKDSGSIGFPRIAVAGAKPDFFVFRTRENAGGEKDNTFALGEIQKWRTDSVVWAHRMKRKAALSWQGFRRQEILGLVGGSSEHKESRRKNGTCGVDRAPVTYIIATQQLEAGKMVMNWSKPSSGDSLRPAGSGNVD